MEKQLEKDPYKFSRIMYIIEAALEYFISILVGESYLAKLTSEMGISDSLTGIMSSFVSLGATFQIVTIFLANKTPVKRWVTFGHITNQLFFTLLYVIPIVPLSSGLRTGLFVVFLLGGNIINQVINSPKINWFMSMVDNKKRGVFTANKEIISLVSGMVFTFGMSRIIDSYEARGDINGAFILIGVTLFVLTALHTATLVFSKEKPVTEKITVTDNFKSIVKDPGFFKIALVSVLWTVASNVSVPFYGTYKIKELGFSMTFISLLTAGYSILRSVFSRPLGKYADKHSFVSMLNICFCVEGVGLLVNCFCVPSNGKVIFTIYYLLHAIALAGINSSVINLIYDYVTPNQRVSALAIKSALAGIMGFLTTLTASIPVKYFQTHDVQLFGTHIYAQQAMTFVTFLFVLGILAYINLVVKKMKRADL